VTSYEIIAKVFSNMHDMEKRIKGVREVSSISYTTGVAESRSLSRDPCPGLSGAKFDRIRVLLLGVIKLRYQTLPRCLI